MSQRNFWLKGAEIKIGKGHGLLCHGKRLYKFRIVIEQNAGDREIFNGPRRKDAIVRRFWYFHFTNGIFSDTD